MIIIIREDSEEARVLMEENRCPESLLERMRIGLSTADKKRLPASAPLPHEKNGKSVHTMQQEPAKEVIKETPLFDDLPAVEKPKRKRRRKKPCETCGEYKFWRQLGTSRWLCGKCHPPGALTNIEWND